jgi:hypothetical protein
MINYSCWQSCCKNEGGSLALVKFDMHLAISHHFPGGISLFKSSELVNMSLSIKQVPLLWKIAHVSPSFNGKGNPHSSQNYHPISVISIVCKIMEIIRKIWFIINIGYIRKMSIQNFSFIRRVNKNLAIITYQTITVRPNDKPFMNNKVRNKIRQRNRMHCKAETTNNPDHWKIK